MLKLFWCAVVALSMMTPAVLSQDESDEDVTYILELVWSPSGDKIAAVGVYPGTIRDDGMIPDDVHGYIHVVDVFTEQTVFMSQPPSAFTSATWSPDGKLLALGSFDGTVWIVDALTGESITNLFGHQSTVTDVDWSHDGTKIVSSGNWDELVILWDAVSYEILNQYTLTSFLQGVEFSADDRTLAVGTQGGLFLLSVDQPMEISTILASRVLNEWINYLAYDFNSDLIAIGTIAHTSFTTGIRDQAHLYIVDTATGTVLHRSGSDLGSISGLSWNADGQTLAILHEDDLFTLWDIETGTISDAYDVSGIGRYKRGGIAYSHYGGRLAYGQAFDSDSEEAPFQIIVPAPSLDRLAAIVALCVRDGDSRAESLIDITPTALDDLPAFVAQVEALPDGAIPPACKADVLAVASALGN